LLHYLLHFISNVMHMLCVALLLFDQKFLSHVLLTVSDFLWLLILHVNGGKKGKVFPYSLPSVGPGADPGVQAVSPQVT